jgi:hypothetical protein
MWEGIDLTDAVKAKLTITVNWRALFLQCESQFPPAAIYMGIFAYLLVLAR